MEQHDLYHGTVHARSSTQRGLIARATPPRMLPPDAADEIARLSDALLQAQRERNDARVERNQAHAIADVLREGLRRMREKLRDVKRAYADDTETLARERDEARRDNAALRKRNARQEQIVRNVQRALVGLGCEPVD